MAGLVFHDLADFGIVRLLDEIPDLAFRIAEAGEGAQVFLVGEPQRRAVNGLGLLEVGLMAGRFRAVEMDFGVGAVAEGFVGGLAAAAQGVLLWCRKLFPFPIFQRVALGIGNNPLLAQGQVAADEIRAVLGDGDLWLGWGRSFSW